MIRIPAPCRPCSRRTRNRLAGPCGSHGWAGHQLDAGALARATAVLFLALLPVAILAARPFDPGDMASSAAAPTRIDNRESFGGRLAGGTVTLNTEADAEAALTLDGALLSAAPGARFAWDTTAHADGRHALALGEAEAALDILNAAGVVVHGGRLATSETWDAGHLHLVRNWVVVPSGVTLTVEPGAVVLFCRHADLVVELGGVVTAIGTEAAPILFTHVADPAAGSGLDTGGETPGVDTYGIEVLGTLTLSPYTQVRYRSSVPGYPQISIGDRLVDETDGTVKVPVSLSVAPPMTIRVAWRTEDGTATAGEDYQASNGVLTWAAGQTARQFITVPLIVAGEGKPLTETFFVQLGDPCPATIARDRATVWITGPAGLPPDTTASSTPVLARLDNRESFGGRLACGTVTLNTEADAEAALTLDSALLSAAPGARFAWDTTAHADGRHALALGEAETGVDILNAAEVAVHGGRLAASETWDAAHLHLVRNWVAVPSGVTLTVEAGATVRFCRHAGLLVEPGGVVTAIGTEAAPILFTHVADPAAGNGPDTGGETPGVDDYGIEVRGTLTLSPCTQIRYRSSIPGYPQISTGDRLVDETDGTVQVPVSISAAPTVTVRVSWHTEDGTALAGEDYEVGSGVLTWTAGQTARQFITLPLIAAEEGKPFTETFFVQLAEPYAATIARDRATVWIMDNSVGGGGSADIDFVSVVSDAYRLDLRNSFGARVVQGTVDLPYDAAWRAGAATTRTTRNGTQVAAGEAGVYQWDTATASEVENLLDLAWFDAAGQPVDSVSTRLYVLDDAVLHRGRLEANETWGAGRVHLVLDAVVVPAGVTLTIEPGAVVKFCDGTGLVVETGGTVFANGAILTHVADDTVGGDTNLDGSATQPVPDGYSLSGAVVTDAATQLRHTTQTAAGTISASQTWLSGRVYKITGNITVPNGITLTILPGAVVKFGSNLSITVNSGGTLVAEGNRAMPIVFTSYRDDSHGGDTNGDGDATRAEAGDWNWIDVVGHARLNCVRAMYGGPQNERGILQVSSSGVLEIENSLIAHSMYDGLWNWGGTITVTNSIIADVGLGAAPFRGRSSYINCVFRDVSYICMYWSHWRGDASFENCSFSGIMNDWMDLNGNPSPRPAFAHCAFWNPAGNGPQIASPVGTNGNLWGNPLFRDPENGDFSLRAGSPLIDAGDGAAAPELDAMGQPRFDDPQMADRGTPSANGACPDIGVCEYTEGAASEIDLVVNWVQGPLQATVGEEIEVRWQVTNAGTQTAVGPWRDTVEFVSGLTGRAVSVGERVVSPALASGGTTRVATTVRVPAVEDGDWTVRVRANAHRDVFEGTGTANNTKSAAVATSLTVPILAVGSSEALAGGTGIPLLRRVPVLAGQAVTIRLSAGRLDLSASALVAPTEGAADWQGSVLPDGSSLLCIPPLAEATAVYLLLSADETWSGAEVRATPAVPALLAVGNPRVTNTGSATLVLYGTGFAEGMTAALECAGFPTVAAAGLANIQSPTKAAVTFDLNGRLAGTYDLVLQVGGTEVRLARAVEVTNGGKGPVLEARLDMPDTVRDGRIYTAWVAYANTGDADMLAPLLSVDSSTSVPLAAELAGLSNQYAGAVRVMGISPTAPAGVLKPGDSGRIPIYFRGTPNVHVKLSLIRADDQLLEELSEFETWGEYHTALAQTANRLNLRGRPEWRVPQIHRMLIRARRGQPVAAISGALRHALTGELLAGYPLSTQSAGSGPVSACTSDANGVFQLEWLWGRGECLLESTDLYDISPIRVAFTQEGGDINGLVVTALPRCSIAGTVRNGDGEDLPASLEGLEVVLVVTSGASPERTILARTGTDSRGEFRFAGLLPGTYAAQIASADGRWAPSVEGVEVSATSPQAHVSFLLRVGAVLTGAVTDAASGAPVPGALVSCRAGSSEAGMGVSGDDGVYSVYGLPPGSYAVSVLSETHQEPGGIDVVCEAGLAHHQDFVLNAKVPFYPTPAGGEVPLAVTFSLLDEEAGTDCTFEWDFDGDGTVDSTEARPTHTYGSTGSFGVSLTLTSTARGAQTFSVANCVRVSEPVEVVVRDNVILVDDDPALTLVSKTENGLVLQRDGDPVTAVTEGAILIGGKDAGEDHYARRVLTVEEAGDVLTLQTEEVGIGDVFEQFSVSDVVELTDEDMVDAGFARSADRGSWKWSGAAGISVTTSTEFRPGIDFECRRDVDGVHVRCVLVARLDVSVDTSVYCDGAGHFNPEKALFTFRKDCLFMVGLVPVWITIECPVKVGIDINVKGKLSVHHAVTRSTAFRVGVQLEGGRVTPVLSKEDTGPTTVPSAGFAVDGECSVYVEPSCTVWLYGLSNVGANVRGYVKLGFGIFPRPKVSFVRGFGIGLEANLADLGQLDLDYKIGKSWSWNWERVIAEWAASESRFDASATSGGAPLTVSFTDTSILGVGGIESWQWDFGDGATSTSRSPAHTYSGEGNYEVTLLARGRYVTYEKPATIRIRVSDGEDPEGDPDPGGGQTAGIAEETPTTPQSCDPNEMAGPVGFGDSDTERFVIPGQWMEYTIYFENRSDATAAAQEVWVTNPLSGSLDWATLELGEVVFSNQTELGLVGKRSGTMEVEQQGTAYKLRVEFSLDQGTGEAKWYLRTVDPASEDGWPTDAYAGFLPPNDGNPDDEGTETDAPGAPHCGEGHLTYRIKLKDEVPAGTRVDNSATIVFDYNDAIETDPAWFNLVAGDAPTTVELTSPADAATGVATTESLSWSVAEFATEYAVYVWPDGEERPADPTRSGQRGSVFSSTGGMAYDTTYHWQVVAANRFGSAESAVWTFTTADEPPTRPASESPANGETGVLWTRSLDWGDCERAASYEVYLWKASDLKPETATAAGVGESHWAPQSRGVVLEPDTAYCWQVVAKSRDNQKLGPTWRFRTKANDPATFDLAGSYDSVGGWFGVTGSNWQDPEGAAECLRYEWRHNGVAVAGLDGPDASLADVVGERGEAGLVSCRVTAWDGWDEGQSTEYGWAFYSLEAGWNIVALPLSVDDARPEALFSAADEREPLYSGTVWSWNGDTLRYERAETLAPGRGYWLYVPSTERETGSVVVEGIVPAATDFPLDLHWRLLGFPPFLGGASAEDIRATTGAEGMQEWRDGAYGLPTGMLEFLRGYWLYLREAKVLTPVAR